MNRWVNVALYLLPLFVVLLFTLIPGNIWRAATGLMAVAFVLALSAPGLYLFLSTLVYSILQDRLSSVDLVLPGGLSSNASQALVAVICAGLALRLTSEAAIRRKLPAPPRAAIPFLLFFLVAVLRTPASPGIGATSEVLRLGACLFIFYAAAALAPVHGRYIRASIVAAGLAAALSAILESFHGPPTEAIAAGAFRAAGSFGAVGTATVAFCAIPALMEFAERRQAILARAGVIISAAVIVFGMIATVTRTTVVGFVIWVFATVAIVPRFRVSRWKLAFLAIFLVFVMAAAISLLPKEYVEARIADLPGGSSTDFAAAHPSYGSGRLMIWSNVLKRQADSSLVEWCLGHGMGSVPRAMQSVLGRPLVSHNAFLEVLFDLGVLGLTLFLALNVAVIRELWRYASTSTQSTVAPYMWLTYFIAYLFSTQFFNTFVFNVGPQWFTFLGIGYIVGISRMQVAGQDLPELPERVPTV